MTLIHNTSKGGVFPEAGGTASAYIDTTKSTAINTTLQGILSSKTLQNEMSEKGRIYAQRFSMQKITENLMEIYKEVASTTK